MGDIADGILNGQIYISEDLKPSQLYYRKKDGQLQYIPDMTDQHIINILNMGVKIPRAIIVEAKKRGLSPSKGWIVWELKFLEQ